MPLHSTLSDPDIHEPKGIAVATANKVYVSDGSGSGTWSPLSLSFCYTIANISTPGEFYIPIAYDCRVVRIVSVIDGAISTADDTLTFKNSAGASMGTITVAFSGSAAGDTDILNPTSNNTLTSGSYIKIEVSGASSAAATAQLVFIVERT